MAREFESELLVVGSRGLSDWQSLVRHSVSPDLLTAVDCPLLIVRGDKTMSVDRPRHVLLALAGGDDIANAVRAAAAAASGSGSMVLVIHVIQAMVTAHDVAYVEPGEEARITIDTAIDMLRQAGVEADGWVMRPGPVGETVADTAARWHADIIVIGSARLGDLGSILFGSVTHDLLRATKVPVLIAEKSHA